MILAYATLCEGVTWLTAVAAEVVEITPLVLFLAVALVIVAGACFGWWIAT